MERLGIQDGESIESRLVTRAVENAQKKVENLHFESRKYILEYDDVANEQRKAIYKYRDELLDENYDLSEKIDANRLTYVEYLLEQAEIYNITPKDSFNLETLSTQIYNEIGEKIEISELEKANDYNELSELITANLKSAYDVKMRAISDEQRKSIEKMVYLQIVDKDWREHLYQMDTLKAGIGLRGYNHKDPLVEYKKESYNLFIELIYRLKRDSIRMLQMIRFTFEDGNSNQISDTNSHANLAQNLDENQDASETKHTSRNESCPCGSGKKYKDCCGKSGPKVGKFAKK